MEVILKKVELKLYDQHGLKTFNCYEVFYPVDGVVCFAYDDYPSIKNKEN